MSKLRSRVLGLLLLLVAFSLGYLTHRQRWIPLEAREGLREILGGKEERSGPNDGSRTSLPDGMDAEKWEQMRAIGYLGGTRPAQEQFSRERPPIRVHDPQRAYEGTNLYISGHAPAAYLMGMDGEILHTWELDFSEAAPDHWVHSDPSVAPPTAWRRVYLYENGDLLASYDNFSLFKIDKDSDPIWEYEARTHHDLFVDDAESIFVLTQESRVVPSIREEEPVWEDFVVQLDPNGKEIRKTSLLECFQNSRYAPLIDHPPITRTGGLFHTNTLERIDSRMASRIPDVNEGDVLVSLCYLDTIAVVNLEEQRVVWALNGFWRRQHQPTVLDNGNLLIFDNNRYGDDSSKVWEFDPLTQDVKWVFGLEDPVNFYSATLGSCQRLPNGNTLITDSESGRAFEVTRDNEVVWSFKSPHRVGEGDELVAHLFELIRLGPEFPLGWVGE